MSLVPDAVNRPSLSRCWREWELWLVIALTLIAYTVRLGDLTIRGEETRRALVAREMLQTGDWLVPRTQGEPLLSRPPLQNWLIAGIAMAQGTIDEFTVRLPSTFSILGTAILLYFYARGYLSRLGAFASALVFVSLGQVIELGRFGETDAMFTLCVAGSILIWHLGWTRNWNPYITWIAGYVLAALGTLTKGPQAPVYFASIVGMTLLLRWRLGDLFRLPSLVGAALFALVVGSWQIPFMQQMGSNAGSDIYVSDVGHRFLDASWSSFFQHLGEYPLEMFGCLLPWSILMIVWHRAGFRASLAGKWPQIGFQITALVVAFPSVWLPPGSRPRYFMSLYPCIALLIGTTIDRLAAAAADVEWRRMWPFFVRACAVAISGFGIAIAGISAFAPENWLAQSFTFNVVHLAGTSLASLLLWRWAPQPGESGFRPALVTIASFVICCQVGVMTNAHQTTTPDTIQSVAELRQILPAGTRLFSMGMAHHMFVFHYGDVEYLPWPATAADVPPEVEYFCVDARWLDEHPLPFNWETLQIVPCSKHKVQLYQIRMYIGRRTPATDTDPKKPAELLTTVEGDE